MKRRISIFSILFALTLGSWAHASPPPHTKAPHLDDTHDPDRSEESPRKKLLRAVTQKMMKNKGSSEQLLMWTTDYIVLAARLPREEAYTALNRLSEFYDGFKSEEQVAFAVFILNQKEIKQLIDNREIRDLLFTWTTKILESHPLSEEHAQDLLIYWANATQKYADGTEYKEKIETLIGTLGRGLPSVSAMSDWFQACSTIVAEKREHYRDALLSFIPVIRNNRILNTILTPNMDLNFSIHYPHWKEEMSPKDIFHGIPVSSLEFAFVFNELWAELNRLVKDNLFKIPSSGKTKIPEQISEKMNQPLFYTLELQRNFRTLLFQEFIDYNFEIERTQDIETMTQTLQTYSDEGYFEELTLSFFALSLSPQPLTWTPEQKTKIQALTQFMLSHFPESQKNFVTTWMMLMGTSIDFTSLDFKNSPFTITEESPPLLIWHYKNMAPDLWEKTKQPFYTYLLTSKEHENIAVRMMEVRMLMDRLTQMAGVPEDHLMAFLMFIHLKQAFKEDTQDYNLPLFRYQDDTQKGSHPDIHKNSPDEPTFMFHHYTQLEQLHALISPQLLGIGLNELDSHLLPVMASELIAFIKKKLEKETLDQSLVSEKNQLINDVLEFQSLLINKSKSEGDFRQSYLPLTPAAVSSIGRVMEKDNEAEHACFKSQTNQSVELYETDTELDDVKFEKGSEQLIKSIKGLKKEDFKNDEIKYYFVKWIPLHYIKGNKADKEKFLDDLLALLDDYANEEYMNRLRLIIQGFMKIPRSPETESAFIDLTQQTIQNASELSQDLTFSLGDVVFHESEHLLGYLNDPCLLDTRKIEFSELRSSLFSLISAAEIGNGDAGRPELTDEERENFSNNLNQWLKALIFDPASVGENGNKVLNFPRTDMPKTESVSKHFIETQEESLNQEIAFLKKFEDLNPGRKKEVDGIIEKMKSDFGNKMEEYTRKTPESLDHDPYQTFSYFKNLTAFIIDLTPIELNRYMNTIETKSQSTWNVQDEIFHWMIQSIQKSPYMAYTFSVVRELLKLGQIDSQDHDILSMLDRIFPEVDSSSGPIGSGPYMYEQGNRK